MFRAYGSYPNGNNNNNASETRNLEVNPMDNIQTWNGTNVPTLLSDLSSSQKMNPRNVLRNNSQSEHPNILQIKYSQNQKQKSSSYLIEAALSTHNNNKMELKGTNKL
jgi:hypothetical protein